MQFLPVGRLPDGRGGVWRGGLQEKAKREKKQDGQRWQSARHVEMDNQQCSVSGNEAKSVDSEAVVQESHHYK